MPAVEKAVRCAFLYFAFSPDGIVGNFYPPEANVLLPRDELADLDLITRVGLSAS